MKKIILTSILVSSALLCGCNKADIKETVSSDRFVVETAGVRKTTLGPVNEGVSKVLWATGDKVTINGVTSNPLDAAYNESTSAEFTFPSVISAPYRLVYPAQTSEDVIVIPSAQTYTAGSFDPAATPMYGSGSSVNLPLHNLSAVLRFGFTGTGTLDRLVLKTKGGENIAGSYAMTVSSGAYTGEGSFTANQSDEITMALGGLALSGDVTYIYIPVIRGSYSKGFELKVYADATNYMKLSFFGSGKTLSADKLYLFTDKAFSANTSDSEASVEEYGSEEVEFGLSMLDVKATPSAGVIPSNTVAGIFETTASGTSSIVKSTKTVSGTGFVTFTFPIEKSASTSFKYVSVYPAEAAVINGNDALLTLPSTQYTDCVTAAPDAFLGYASSTSLSARPTSLDLDYTVVGAPVNIQVNNMPAGETVKNIAITSNTANLAGSVSVNISTGVASVSGGTKTINVIPKGWTSGTICPALCLPGTVNGFEATVVTDKNIYKITSADVVTVSASSTANIVLNIGSATKKDVLRVFLIGNSFTQDACHQLPGVVAGAGITNMEITQCYYGGRTVPEYNNGWETSSDYTKHTALPGDSSMTNTSGANLKTVAESKEWDIVCIQEHTGNYLAWTWNDSEKRHISELMEKVAATQTVRPQFYYILSQTYYDMGKIGSGSQSSITWSDQAGMFDVIVAFGKKVMEELPFTGICATGTTLQNLRQTSLMNSMCLTRDGYHMDYGISRYAAACCLYETFIYPRYGISLDVNTYRSDESNYTSGSYRTPITDENVPIAIQAARDAVAHPFEITYQSHQYGTDGAAGTNPGTKDYGNL